MISKVFVDTNVFVALRDKNDSTHKRAVKLLEKLHNKKGELYISSDIIGETLTVLSRKLGKAQAEEYLKDVDEGFYSVIFVDDTLHNEARRLFLETSSKNISFIDCSSVVCMKANNIEEIFSFDDDFKRLGVKLIQL